MKFFEIILLMASAIIIAYLFTQYFLFKRLKQKLGHTTRDAFIKSLGDHYKVRPLDSNLHRYKWLKGIFIIRANFNDKGNLVGMINISRRHFFDRTESVAV
ncbi:MAG: hypothetical protein QM802_19405 [Agriterribacter sp.]